MTTYGLKYYDIINLFAAKENDFATPNMNNGKANIEQEIEFQSGKLLGKIPSTVLLMLNRLVGVKVNASYTEETSGSYGFSSFVFPESLPPIDNSDVDVYYIDENCLCKQDSCPDTSIEDVGELVSGSITETDGVYVWTSTDDIDLSDKDVYVSYDVDQDSEYFSIAEIAGVLRDMVACVLGSRLMIEGESTFRLLDIVCATEDKWMPTDKWVPAELKKLSWWRKPWKIGLTIGKFLRA